MQRSLSRENGRAQASPSLLRFLQHAFQRELRSGAPQLDLLSGGPDLVTAAVLFAAVQAKFVLLHAPPADRLASHRMAGERAARGKNVAPMDLVGDLHAGKLGADLRTRKLL